MVATAPERGPLERWGGLYVLYAATALVVYARVLSGGFVSDDMAYLLNPWVQHLSWANLRAILDPTGPVAAYTANYAPVHVLAHALLLQVFGGHVVGHHVVDVLVHAGVATLFAALLVRGGLGFAASAWLAGIFLVHPANVEAVAWISQLKTTLALLFACAALLLEPRHPALAMGVFVLAIATKLQAAFALPVAALACWTGPEPAAEEPSRFHRAAWLLVWAALLAVLLLPEGIAFERLGHSNVSTPGSLAERGCFMLALLGRYLAMAATAWGTSAFHQPDPPAGWGDPWVLLGGAGLLALVARTATTLWRRDPEAVWWVWAGAALLPVSQLLPFVYPMADRYLYFVLPGLLGGVALAVRRAGALRKARPDRLQRAGPDRLQRAGRTSGTWARAAGAAAAMALLVALAVRSSARATVYRSDLALTLDSAAHYPDGLPARRLQAAEAARRGDVDSAVAAIRAAVARGFDRFGDLERDPTFDPIRSDPRFRAVVAEVAAAWIAHVAPRGDLTQQELVMLGQAYRARGEWDHAMAALEQAAADPGPDASMARAELAVTRAARLRAAREGGEDGPAGP
jgi:hypothetical protein